MQRFAGFPSPDILIGDPHLSREDKIDALESWRILLAHDGVFDQDDPRDRKRLMREISSALETISHA